MDRSIFYIRILCSSSQSNNAWFSVSGFLIFTQIPDVKAALDADAEVSVPSTGADLSYPPTGSVALPGESKISRADRFFCRHLNYRSIACCVLPLLLFTSCSLSFCHFVGGLITRENVCNRNSLARPAAEAPKRGLVQQRKG